jgi:hypothetical protein
MNPLSCLKLALATSVFGLCAGSAVAQTAVATLPEIPAPLQVPAEQNLLLKVAAKGSQIYVCQAQADKPDRFEWIFKAPEAELLDENGQPFGSHYDGPTWEASDGSKVMGEIAAKAEAPQSDTIPWLLLDVKERQGEGVLSPVSWVQRLNTVGGEAPAEGCSRAQQNREVRIAYTADYYFYGKPDSPSS